MVQLENKLKAARSGIRDEDTNSKKNLLRMQIIQKARSRNPIQSTLFSDNLCSKYEGPIQVKLTSCPQITYNPFGKKINI